MTDRGVHNAKPRADKPYKLFDGRGSGLHLVVMPAGGKYWRVKYRFGGKEKLLSLGVYPQIGLKDARDRASDARRLLAQGIDPGAAKKAHQSALEAESRTFEKVAREWLDKFSAGWSDGYTAKVRDRLERKILPSVGDRPVAAISPAELLAAIRRIEETGALETAHRTLQHCSAIFRYAVACGQADRDPAADLRGALPPVRARHHPSLVTPAAVGGLLRAIDSCEGSFVVRCALKLAPLVFVRPGELRKAEWSEIDLDGAEWRIPGTKMKMREAHIVPLARQAVAILRELQPLTGSGRYVFPSERTGERPMSNNTVNAALRRLGYGKDEMTGHGFRSLASTMLNELSFPPDVIERQLAHAPRNQVRAAYDRSQHLEARRVMMQAWADYLDGLAAGAKVILLKRGGRE